ncbi:synaptopodin 2-like protein [Triplophysa rosa]|uniref:Synaptopodin n=1 Tax=Triplophysa rosa TaxID=992332 RepID=A0A9W7TSB8_TRIRA|nr:synaptopodin 2-like protein [Triplophysa rosa]XP_057204838.1 synaptopodin 2-like protein [Triplophysa rosa]XP_057204839.1 synaptopodin 2-like protein [Triplophysa rosa]XP_057204840.1 synaptopodin 2-like protein [Triplophysa rosa]KAI7801681.1 putative synaptopodin [Triplophysa rosa]
MDYKHEPVRRGDSWGGPTATSSTPDRAVGEKSLERTWILEKDDHCGVKGKPDLTTCISQVERKTNLSRSASLSEKELKEARTKSQIIAAQLQANSNSKGVQLFNRRRQRVNAFTLVSVGGGGAEESKNVIDSPSKGPWDKPHTAKDHKELNHRNLTWSAGKIYGGGCNMEDVSEVVREDVVEERERHFLPVNEKDEELSEGLTEAVKDEITSGSDSNTVVLDSVAQEEPQENGGHAHSVDTNKDLNGYSTQCNGKITKAVTTKTSIINRTARPFFSPTTVGSSEVVSPVMDIPPAPSYDSPPLPPFQEPPTTYFQPQSFTAHTRPVFSQPPPPPSYPTPPLPSYSIPPPPDTAIAPSPQPSSCYICPSAPRPTFVPELLTKKRSVTPIKTGILDEGMARRATRKSMFTFQEKPKVAPNPELLSLVQGADEKKKQKAQPDPSQEEELLALGAEASNFLAKEEVVHKDALVPEWASCLKSSRTHARTEHKPEQALTNASGKGAELFAKRQSRMERYVHDSKEQRRSPSPTMSLPPSWVYPSNMPGRVKAIVNSSNVSAQISMTLKAHHGTQKKTPVKTPEPSPAPEVPLENGCTKIEMELSKHQPYQLNSSLFIFNPTKDPYSTLPRAAPPPKPVMTGYTFSRQTSLPTSQLPSPYSPSAAYRSTHCFSPPMMPCSPCISSPVSPLAPERVASPRSGVQVPRPTFSAKKAGITPQIKEETPIPITSPGSTTPTSWTPNLTRRFTSPDVLSSAVWSPSSPVVTSTSTNPIYKPTPTSHSPRPIHKLATTSPSPGTIFKPPATSPLSPPWENRCHSPAVIQDTKANHRILAKNIINAAKRKNSPSPGALSGHSLPISPVSAGTSPNDHKPVSPFQPRMLGAQSPTLTSPSPTHMIHSPVRLYNTRSLTDSDASVESEDSGLRSPGVRSYKTCPRGWTASLQVKRGSVPEDL